MSLQTVPIVKNSHIYTGIYFIFLKNVLQNFESLSIATFGLGGEIGKAVSK